ncbi:hypothetical protein LCGC14_1415400 [marine sediment metagenome]|uniref:Uncharacterized protein n=1 Tax=marine sediment metagenome TaxID=412755 RepID=A0A0F9JSZ7_9ZZZZ
MYICQHILAVVLAVTPAAAVHEGTALPLLLELEGSPAFELRLALIRSDQIRSAPIDLEAAMARAVDELLQERDPETGRFVVADDGTGFFGMMAAGSYDPAVLAYFAASAVEIYTAYDLQNQCDASTIVSCSRRIGPELDAALTAGIFAGVTGLQRLAKTQWGVDLDEGWKQVAIWGAMAAVRGMVSASNIQDANALRELGR